MKSVKNFDKESAVIVLDDDGVTELGRFTADDMASVYIVDEEARRKVKPKKTSAKKVVATNQDIELV